MEFETASKDMIEGVGVFPAVVKEKDKAKTDKQKIQTKNGERKEIQGLRTRKKMDF